MDVHLAGVDFEDRNAGLLIRQRELDLAVESATAHQRWIENIDAIGGTNDLRGKIPRSNEMSAMKCEPSQQPPTVTDGP